MKQGLTEIVVVLDRSGSMTPIQKDMEGGFDTFIAEQRKLPGDARVTLCQFDDQYEVVYSGKSLADVPPLSLLPRDSTALNDALAKTILATGERLDALPEAERPERVLVLVITDGGENASREYKGDEGRKRVLDMVKHQTEKYSWQFVYIGANQDALAVGAGLGIQTSSNYVADSAGTQGMFKGVSRGIGSYRSGGGYRN